MKPKSAHDKGKRFENIVCQEIEAEGLGKSVRTPGSGSGKLKGDIFNNLDFMIECKNQKSIQWWQSVDQAQEQARIGNYDSSKWALVVRDPRSPEKNPEIYAMIDFWQFLRLLKTAQQPKIKKPDRETRWHLEQLRSAVNQVIKDLK